MLPLIIRSSPRPGAGLSEMMGDRPRERIERLVAVVDGPDLTGRLCRASVDALSVTGASAMVMSGGIPSPLFASDLVAARLEDLQQVLGEGPCVDAHERGRAVSEPDLAAPSRARWPAFGPAALAAGAGALFSFPLRIGVVCLGALTLYEREPGPLSADQHAEARTLAGIVAIAILTIQAQAPPGTLSPALEVLASHRAEIHQASGMVSLQLGVGVGEARMALRARAYSTERPLADVAADVVAGRLRLDE